MTSKFLLMMISVFTFIILGCSDQDPITDNDRSAMIERPMKTSANGTFNLVPTEACDPALLQFAIEGEGNGTHVGKFTVDLTNCTNLDDVAMISGIMTAANGDEINFASIGSGIDDNGFYVEYMVDGGTGRFEYATGLLRIYEVIEFTSPYGGIFSNEGVGTITY